MLSPRSRPLFPLAAPSVPPLVLYLKARGVECSCAPTPTLWPGSPLPLGAAKFTLVSALSSNSCSCKAAGAPEHEVDRQGP
eukprot:scaffold73812_cov27-Tisochrysis_lutea.AAC.1